MRNLWRLPLKKGDNKMRIKGVMTENLITVDPKIFQEYIGKNDGHRI